MVQPNSKLSLILLGLGSERCSEPRLTRLPPVIILLEPGVVNDHKELDTTSDKYLTVEKTLKSG